MYQFDLSVLEHLVNLNSQTQNVPGVTAAQKFLGDQFQDLGMSIEWHPNKEFKSADALIATFGRGSYVVTLLGHVDTVAKGGEFFPFQKSEEGILQGAGIADMKGGLSIMIEALKKVLPCISDELTIKVVISPNEEVGSLGFQDLFSAIGKESHLVLCFEPALEDGSIIGGRNGNRWYDFHFTGEKLHTGRAPKGSANVLHQLCELQQVLATHVSDDDKTKFNFTSITTNNEKYNVSSSEAFAKMDLRFATLNQREVFHDTIMDWREQSNVSLSYNISDDCPPLANVTGGDIVDELRSKLESAESRSLSCLHCEGASDANYFSSPHNIVVDGLGPRGDFFHSRKEYLIEASLGNRTHGLVQFLLDFVEKKPFAFSL